MADIRPFRGIRYNPKLVEDLTPILCPPYDVISPEEQQAYYRMSDYNIIHLEYGQELPEDGPGDNKYTRAAASFQHWLDLGILQADDRPAFYLHNHYFSHRGERRKRQGIMACVRLEQWERGIIRPHECTLAAAKDDRINLMRACRANLSPIFGLYDDPEHEIASLLARQERASPHALVTDVQGQSHEIWAVTEPEVIHQVAGILSDKPIYIADGHHRYETALAYREEQCISHLGGMGNQAFGFVMMTLVDISDPGLVILPLHRLVHGIPQSTVAGLRNELEAFFELKALPLAGIDNPGWADALSAENEDEIVIGLCGLDRGHLFRLTLPDSARVQHLMPGEHSRAYRRLDVSVLQHVVLEGMLGISDREEDRQAVLAYSSEEVDALRRVMAEEYQLLFLLNPIGVRSVKAIADAGDRAHPKSTYFYPKPPTGLVIHRLEAEL
jgi:uncharacterized protein (DUF1015 family)